MNRATKADFRYGVYTRKSSESEDSQIQSIQRQIDDLSMLIDRDGLTVYQECLTESRSAFHPGREEFAKLVEWTNRGRINAWLCWHANRLSRNPVDAGTIVYLMDQGKLHHIRTRDRIYYNTPGDKFMLQMEFTMSKKDSDDKSVLVKSGILRRHRRGYPTGFPPTGYTLRGEGRSGQSFWVVDPAPFDLARKVLLKFLQGNDSLSTIQGYAAESGLVSKARPNRGGYALSRSGLYATILTNPIYSGHFYGTDGQRYELDRSLPRAITEEDFERIQEILGKRNANRRQLPRRIPSYHEIIRSPEGYALGADRKFQVICDCRGKFAYRNRKACPSCKRDIDSLSAPHYLQYTYYYSVRDRKRKLPHARSIEEKKVDQFVIKELARPMRISKPLRDWAVKYLDELRDAELIERKKEAAELEEARNQVAFKRKRIRDLFVIGQMSEEEYFKDIAELDRSFEEMERHLAQRSNWHEDACKALNLAVELEQIIVHGSPSAINQALKDLGSNLIWDGNKLNISNAKTSTLLIETLNLAKSKNPEFEPENCVDTSSQNPVFQSVRTLMSQGLDRVRT